MDDNRSNVYINFNNMTNDKSINAYDDLVLDVKVYDIHDEYSNLLVEEVSNGKNSTAMTTTNTPTTTKTTTSKSV